MSTASSKNAAESPSVPILALALVLAGFATMLLGPILPIFAQRWHLTDAQTGQLLLAQFLGATLGGATLTRTLPRDFLLGLTAAFAGFLSLAYAPSLSFTLPCLLIAGFGVGRTIASVNIIAGARATQHRGSTLSRLNIGFSVGCLLSPMLAASLNRFPLANRLTGFAILFALLTLALAYELRKSPAHAAAQVSTPTRLRNPIFLLFLAVLFLYGGLETCLGGWFTTYAFRYGNTTLVLSQITMMMLLVGLVFGHWLGSVLLTKTTETKLLRITLVLTIVFVAGLAIAQGYLAICLFAVFLGTVLAPIFPAFFALYLASKPTSRQAGLVLAASGLGAASIPWLMGLTSTQTGSLRIALTLPIAAAGLLLLLTRLAKPNPPSSLEDSQL